MGRTKLIFVIALLVLGTVAFALAGFRGANYTVRQVLASDPASGPSAPRVPALEFVVTSQDVFPARALDPILYVGKVELRQYRYADISNRTLVFTLFDWRKLEDDVPVYLQYGNDKRTRTDLPNFHIGMIKSH